MTPGITDEAREILVETAMDEMRICGVVVYDGSEGRFCPFSGFANQPDVIRADILGDVIAELEKMRAEAVKSVGPAAGNLGLL